MTNKDFSIKELHHHINQLLNQYSNEQSILDVSELDGFVCALGSSPEEISISDWMPAIWGGEENTPDWQSEQEINNFVNAFTDFYGYTLHNLHNDQYTPLFSESVLDKSQDSIADEWCFGYLRGLKLWPDINDQDNNFLNDSLKPIRLFATDEGKTQLENMDKQTSEDLIQEIKKNAKLIYQHFSQ